jgi:hypothetical protein
VKKSFGSSSSLCALSVIPALLLACSAEGGLEAQSESALETKDPNCVLDSVTVNVVGSTQTTVEVEVCAGPSGAPGGFSLQWSTFGDFTVAGHVCSGSECSASFPDPLAANQCVTVSIGDLPQECGVCEDCKVLECGTEIKVRGRAEASYECCESEYSCEVKGSTEDCKEDKGCTLTQGFWKNHPDAWPVGGLILGSVSYTKDQLITILKTPVRGNGLLSLAHQLIAAKLNVLSGADDSDVEDAIEDADALIGSMVVPPFGTGYIAPATSSPLTGELDDFNQGDTGPGHCEDNEEPN